MIKKGDLKVFMSFRSPSILYVSSPAIALHKKVTKNERD